MEDDLAGLVAGYKDALLDSDFDEYGFTIKRGNLRILVTTLEAQAREIVELREIDRRLCDGLELSVAENRRLRDDVTQATTERDDTQAQLMEAVSVMEMARERMDAISREIASRSGIALAPDTRRGQELRCQLAKIKTFLAQSKGTQND